MYILRVPYFLLAKRMGAPQREVLGLIQPFLSYSSTCFLTSISYTGDILYYLLACSTELGIKSIFYFVALSGMVPGFSKMSLNPLHINSQHKGSIRSTLVLSLSPNTANIPLVFSKKWGCNKPNHAKQPCFTSASTFFKLDRVTEATLLTRKASIVC